MELATRRVGERAGQGLPHAWAEAAADAATPPGPELGDALDQAVVGTPLRARDPLWWRVFGYAQWLFAAATVVGFVWLLVLAVVGWLRLPEIETPRLGPLPYPFLLLAAGCCSGCCWRHSPGLWRGSGPDDVPGSSEQRLRDVDRRGGQRAHRAPVSEVLERHAATRGALDRGRAPERPGGCAPSTASCADARRPQPPAVAV